MGVINESVLKKISIQRESFDERYLKVFQLFPDCPRMAVSLIEFYAQTLIFFIF